MEFNLLNKLLINDKDINFGDYIKNLWIKNPKKIKDYINKFLNIINKNDNFKKNINYIITKIKIIIY